ncbi:MAG: DUF4892 domain-containing protein [Oleiphilaceae bacterium]|nr:DUF4892 domain-containing protein [Oleiphilaceae bacterium]
MLYKRIFLTLALSLSPFAFSAGDSDGSRDHPLIGRHPDATLHRFSQQNYTEYRQLVGPLGERQDCCGIDEQNTPIHRVLGKLTRIVYTMPATSSEMELFESHRQSLQKAGYEVVFQCVDSACGDINQYEYLNERLNVVYGLSYLAARSPDGNTHVSLAFVPESDSSDSWRYGVDVAESRPLVNRIRILPPEPTETLPASAPDPMDPDVSGSSDHPLFPRHSSASINRYSQAEFERYRQLLGPLHTTGCCELDAEKTRTETLEGKLTRIRYRVPALVTGLEVMKSYRQSLKRSGYETLFQCEDDDCGNYLTTFKDFEPWVNPVSGLRYIAAKSADDRFRVSVAFPKHGSGRDYNEFVLTVLEKAGMQNRITVLSPDALKNALYTTGKAVLGGIFFDHDSADLMPSSDPALEQVAAMMNSHPDMRIHVVGHTDNSGEFDYNQGLSERRARAVAERLSTTFKVSRDRLKSHGVASLAPQASNGADEGRAHNRRVELVLQ